MMLILKIDDWNELLDLRKLVFNKLEPLQKNKVVKARTEVSVNFESLSSNLLELSKSFDLSELFNVSLVNLGNTGLNNFNLEVLSNNDNYKKCNRCWNYKHNKFFSELLCSNCV
jgi:hypothetical protein